MAEITSYEPGTPSWVDLGSPDIPGAIAFYNQVFGWEAEDQGPEGGGYHMFKLRGKAVAGLGPAMNEGPPYWSSYVTVADLDETMRVIDKEGGTVVMPAMDVLDVGRMGIASDPTGAFFSLWQPGTHIGSELANEPGSLCWIELNTRDVETAQAFYTAVFGWTAKTSQGEMPYTEFQVGDRSVAGMMTMMPEVPAEVPSHWLVYFTVDDCEAAVERVTSAGGSVAVPPTDIPTVGRFALVSDPQGAMFSVIKLDEAAG